MDKPSADRLKEYREKQNTSAFWYYGEADWEKLLTASVDPDTEKAARDRLSSWSSVGRMMETSDGVTISDALKCLTCRNMKLECRVRKDKKGKKCAKCCASKLPCTAGLEKPPVRVAPKVIVPPKPRQFREAFRRSHIGGPGRGLKGRPDAATGPTPVKTNPGRSQETVSRSSARPSNPIPIAIVSSPQRVHDVQPGTDLPGTSLDKLAPKVAPTVAHGSEHTRATSTEIQATPGKTMSIKTEEVDSKDDDLSITQSRDGGVQLKPTQPNLRRAWTVDDGIEDEEFEALQAEAAAKRKAMEVDAFTAQSETMLKRAKFERRKGRIEPKVVKVEQREPETIDLTAD